MNAEEWIEKITDGMVHDGNICVFEALPVLIAEIKFLTAQHRGMTALRDAAATEVKRLRKQNYKLKRFVENIEWGLKEMIE